MLKEGDILKNKYRILRKLGQGGMSSVWLAEDLELRKKWAVKAMDKSSAAYKNALDRDGRLTEIEILNCLDSPFAPRIVDGCEDGQLRCVVMDYVEGRTLASMLEDGTIPGDPELVISWTMDICSLLSYLHRKNIVYRDMKPENIILTADGTVKVVDYGIAKFAAPGQYEDESAVGTKGYAAPEQYRRISGPKSDIYSLCITLYQLLTGIKKPEKLNPAGVGKNRARIPESLMAIIEKGCEKDPEKRFASMDELRDALSEFEKYDENHVRMLRKKLRWSRFLKTAAAVCFTTGLILFTAGVGRDSVQYRRLVNPESLEYSVRAISYKEAAKLKPYSPTACEKLLECYAEDGLSAEEIPEIQDVYERYEKRQWIRTRAYADLSENLALSMIYSAAPQDNLLEVLEKASPYLKNCCDTKYADSLAKGLFAMAGSADAENFPAQEAKHLLNEIALMVQGIGLRIGKNVNAENLRLYAVTACFLQKHYEGFVAAGRGEDANALLRELRIASKGLVLPEADAEFLAQLTEMLDEISAGGAQ